MIKLRKNVRIAVWYVFVFLLWIGTVLSQDTLPSAACEDLSPPAGWSADRTNTLGTMFGNQITETPSAWVLTSLDDNVTPAEKEPHSNCDTRDLPIIYLSGYDDEIFDLIKKIEDEGPGDEVKIAFYMFYKCKYYYIGYLNTTLKILKKVIKNSDHYYTLDKSHLNDYNADIHCNFIEENIIRSSYKKDLKELLKSSEIRKDMEIDDYLKSLAESDERLHKLIDDVEEEKDTEDFIAINDLKCSDNLCERQLNLIPMYENEAVLESHNIICPNTANVSKAFVSYDYSYPINNEGVTNVDQVRSYTNSIEENFKKEGYTQNEDKFCSLNIEVPNYSTEKTAGKNIVEPYHNQKTNNEKYLVDDVNYETDNDIEKQFFCKNDLRPSVLPPTKIIKGNYNGDSQLHTFGIHPCYSAYVDYSHPELLTREGSNICRKYSKNIAVNNRQKNIYQPRRKNPSPFSTSDIKYSVTGGKMFNYPYMFCFKPKPGSKTQEIENLETRTKIKRPILNEAQCSSNVQNICKNICPRTVPCISSSTEGQNTQTCSSTLRPLNSNWLYKYNMPYAEKNTRLDRNIAKIFGSNYLNCDINPYRTSLGPICGLDWCNRPCTKENKKIGIQSIPCSSVLGNSNWLKKYISCICSSENNFRPRISTDDETICSSNYATCNEPCHLGTFRSTTCPNWSKKYIPFTTTTENNNNQNIQYNPLVIPINDPDSFKNCVPCAKVHLKTNKNNCNTGFRLNMNPCMRDIGFYGKNETEQLYDLFKKLDRNILTGLQAPNIINKNVNLPNPIHKSYVNIQPKYISNIIKPQDIEYIESKAKNIASNNYEKNFYERIPTDYAAEKPIFRIPMTNTPYSHTSPTLCDGTAPIFQPVIKPKSSAVAMDILPSIKSQSAPTIYQETGPILKLNTQIPPRSLLTSTTTPIICDGVFSKSNGVRNIPSSQTTTPCPPQLTPKYPVTLIPTRSEIAPQYFVSSSVSTPLIRQYPITPDYQSVIPRKIILSSSVFPKKTQYTVPINPISPLIIPLYPVSITSSPQKIPQESVSSFASFSQVIPENSIPSPISLQYPAVLNSISSQINIPRNISLHSNTPRQYAVPKNFVSAQVKSQYSTPLEPPSQQGIQRQSVSLSRITPVIPQYAALLKSISPQQYVQKTNDYARIMPQYPIPFTPTSTPQVLKQHPVPLSPISPLIMPHNPVTFTSSEKIPTQSVPRCAFFPQVVLPNTVPLNLIPPQVVLHYPVPTNLGSVQEISHIAPSKYFSQQRTSKQPVPLNPISLLVTPPQCTASINLISPKPVKNISPCAAFPQVVLQNSAPSTISPQYVAALNSIFSQDNIPQFKSFHPNRDSLLKSSLLSKDHTSIHHPSGAYFNTYEEMQSAIPIKNINTHSGGTKEPIQSLSKPLEISEMIPFRYGSLSPKSTDYFTPRCKASIFYAPTKYPLTSSHNSKYIPLTTHNSPRTTVDLLPFTNESAKPERYVDPENLLTNKRTLSYECIPYSSTTPPNVNDLSYGQYTSSPNLLCVDSLDVNHILGPLKPVKYNIFSKNFIPAGDNGGIPKTVLYAKEKLVYEHRPIYVNKHLPLLVPASKDTIVISDLKPEVCSPTYSPQNHNSFLQSTLPLYSPKSGINPSTYNPTKHHPTSKFSSFESFPPTPFNSHIPAISTICSNVRSTDVLKYGSIPKSVSYYNPVKETNQQLEYTPLITDSVESYKKYPISYIPNKDPEDTAIKTSSEFNHLSKCNKIFGRNHKYRFFTNKPEYNPFKNDIKSMGNPFHPQLKTLKPEHLSPSILTLPFRSITELPTQIKPIPIYNHQLSPSVKFSPHQQGPSLKLPLVFHPSPFTPDPSTFFKCKELEPTSSRICPSFKTQVPHSYPKWPSPRLQKVFPKTFSIEPTEHSPTTYVNTGSVNSPIIPYILNFKDLYPQNSLMKTLVTKENFSYSGDKIDEVPHLQSPAPYAKRLHVESTNVPDSQYAYDPKVLSPSTTTTAPSIIKDYASHISPYSHALKSPSLNFVETRDVPYSLFTPVPKTNLKNAISQSHVKFSEIPESYYNNILPPTIPIPFKPTGPEQFLSPCDESSTFRSPSRSSIVSLPLSSPSLQSIVSPTSSFKKQSTKPLKKFTSSPLVKYSKISPKTRTSKLPSSSLCLLTKETPFRSNAMLFKAPLRDSCIQSNYIPYSSNTFNTKTISSLPYVESTTTPCDPTMVNSLNVKNTGIPLTSYTSLSNILPLSPLLSPPTIIPFSKIEPLPKAIPSPTYAETKNIPYPAFVSKLVSASPYIDTINTPVTSYESIAKAVPSTPYHKSTSTLCIPYAPISKIPTWPCYPKTTDISGPKYTSDYKSSLKSRFIQPTIIPDLRNVQDSTPPSVNSIITACDPYTLSAKVHLLYPCIQSTSIPYTSNPVKLQSPPCGEVKEIPKILPIKLSTPLLQGCGIQSHVSSRRYTSVPQSSSSIPQLPYVLAPNTLSYIPHFKFALVDQPQPVSEYHLPAYKSDLDKNTALHPKPLEPNLLNAYTYTPNLKTSIYTDIYPVNPVIFGDQVCNKGHCNLPVIPKLEKFLPTYVGSPPKVFNLQNIKEQNGLTVIRPNRYQPITAYSPIFRVSKTKACRPINYLEKSILSTSNTIKKNYPYDGTNFYPSSLRVSNIQMQQDIMQPISVKKSELPIVSRLMSHYPIFDAYQNTKNLANKLKDYNLQKPCTTPYKWDQYPSTTNKPFAQKIESNVEKFININCATKDCIFNGPKQFEIPLGRIGIAKYSNNLGGCIIKTENPCIDLKIWTDKVRIAKAKICFETEEKSVVNFMPVLNKNCKLNPDVVQNIVKNVICKYYGCNPIVLKGYYTNYRPYAIIYNPELLCINSRSYYILWPTYCNCGCGGCGCKCCWQPGYQYCN